ncbi:hypothetical protein Glove_346g138 [Diversispora epigaea]|uniref:NADAR domain-containing protein n=1 Tax=Diversispora epigaea TaxID=1348612 RepID=A0A397HF04_9GLOM|nr:hypothetical protein Glove_346g138 [Diversispora epigaea]
MIQSDFGQVATSYKEAMGEKRKEVDNVKQNYKKNKKNKKKNDDDSMTKGDSETRNLPPFEDMNEEKEKIIENITSEKCLYCTVMTDIPGAYPCHCESESETMIYEILGCHEISVHENPLEPKLSPEPVEPYSEENSGLNPVHENPPEPLSVTFPEPFNPYSEGNSNLNLVYEKLLESLSPEPSSEPVKNLNHGLCSGDLLKSYYDEDKCTKETFQMNLFSNMKAVTGNRMTPTSQTNMRPNQSQDGGSVSTGKETGKKTDEKFRGRSGGTNNGSLIKDGNNETMKSTNSKRHIRSVALVVSFGYGYGINFNSELDEYHRIGIQPISYELRFGIESGIKLVTDVVLNCWANGWKISLFIVSDYIDLEPFVKSLRKQFLKRSLKIVVISPIYPDYCKSAGANVVISGFEKKKLLSLLKEETSRVSNSVFKEEDDIVNFYNRGEPYYEFTNFFMAPVDIDKKIWPTTEHYFQALKFQQNGLREKIRSQRFPGDAFKLGREFNSLKRENWEVAYVSRNFPSQKRLFKEYVMIHALKCKFEQHVHLRYLLLSTGTAKIYEHTERDSYWGDGGIHGKGLNRLGDYLQELRAYFMQRECFRMVRENRQSAATRWIIPGLELLASIESY